MGAKYTQLVAQSAQQEVVAGLCYMEGEGASNHFGSRWIAVNGTLLLLRVYTY